MTSDVWLNIFPEISLKSCVLVCVVKNKTREMLNKCDIPNDLQTRQDKTRQDKTRQNKTRQDKTRQDKTRQDKTRTVNGFLNNFFMWSYFFFILFLLIFHFAIGFNWIWNQINIFKKKFSLFLFLLGTHNTGILLYYCYFIYFTCSLKKMLHYFKNKTKKLLFRS